MNQIAGDLRRGMRALRRSRTTTGLAILAFALGIGITTAVFSVFDAVLVRPLPYPEPEALVVVYDTQPACPACPASYPKYHDWRERNDVFEAIGGAAGGTFVLTGVGEPMRVTAARTTASLGAVFGVAPKLGRWFTDEEDQPGAARVAVLSHGFWTDTLGADPLVLGRRLLLNGEPYQVIGVMPASFSVRNAAVYVPLAMALDPATRGRHFLQTFARLKAGISLERATSDMRALGKQLATEFGHDHGIDLRSYRDVVVGSARGPLQVLLGAGLLVLLIACANVANLQMAAGLARRHELAIQLALGAGPARLARQLAVEGLLLGLSGGVLGVLLASWALQAFLAMGESLLPRGTTASPDGRVLAVCFTLSAGVGILCGLWPLLRLRSPGLLPALRSGDTRTASSGTRLGDGLVVAEIALAFALLVGAGLFVKNLVLLQDRDAGLDTERIVAFDLALGEPRYRTPDQIRSFYRSLHERLSAASGVERVGFVSHLPMRRFGDNGEMNREGGNPWAPGDAPLVEYRWIHGEYFQTLGIRLLRGRLLDDRDRTSPFHVLVNRSMAEEFWPGEDPIGRRFGQGRDRSQWYEVVGVVGDVRSYGLARSTPFEFYRTLDQSAVGAMTVVLKSSGAHPAALVPLARSLVAELDPQLPLTAVQTLEDVVAASVAQPRLLSTLTSLFAGLAGLLAVVGIYGVMAHNVRRQRREFGIRLALGARPQAVWGLVLGRGLRLAGLGIGAGVVGSWMLTGALRSLLNDVQPTDGAVFAGTILAILLVSAAASCLPARSASGVDPIVTLREG